MAEQRLRLDSALGHVAGPAPADQVEGLSTDGAPLALQHDAALASLPPPPPAPGPEFDWGQVLASLQGTLTDAVPLLQWFFLLYLVALNGGYLLLNLAAFFMFRAHLRGQDAATPSRNEAPHEIPTSVIMPAGNDAALAIAGIHAMLQLDYAEFEIIVVADSTSNQVLPALEREFSLAPFPEAYRDRLPCGHVKTVYASTTYPGLRLLDKEGAGRADALNAGLNCARYPLFCSMDAAFILRRDSLHKMALTFQNHAGAVAACASVDIANGCALNGRFIGSIGLPRARPALFQIVEHLRSVRLARMCWSSLNAMLPASGVLGVFHKETVLAAGGYRIDAMDESMELVARLHRLLRRENSRYHIPYVPDPVCWALVPESWKDLKTQHMKRQSSLAQNLEINRQMFLGRKDGAVGWLGFPFVLLFERLGPWLEMSAYAAVTLLWLFGLISRPAFWAFLLAVIGTGMLLSASSLLLGEMTFRAERKFSHALKLFAAALLENFGYRQLTACWRMIGLLRHKAGR